MRSCFCIIIPSELELGGGLVSLEQRFFLFFEFEFEFGFGFGFGLGDRGLQKVFQKSSKSILQGKIQHKSCCSSNARYPSSLCMLTRVAGQDGIIRSVDTSVASPSIDY